MRIIKYLSIALIAGITILFLINLFVNLKSKQHIYSDIDKVPACYTGIVPGALVSHSGRLSNYLKDRVDVAIELYEAKKIQRFLLTGDHGRKEYDEVNSMREYLLEHGINTEHIFLDHAGFDTYNSLYRAKEIFDVKDAIIISQDFHLPRAVYIARKKGIFAFGMVANRQKYSTKHLVVRERLANIKAFFEVLFNRNPHFFGEKIPITGDSRRSYDKQ